MPDDTLKNVSLSIPSTPIQEHPQNVTVVPRRRRKREGEEEGPEKEKDEGLFQVKDKVSISGGLQGDSEEGFDAKEGTSIKKEEPQEGQEPEAPSIDIRI